MFEIAGNLPKGLEAFHGIGVNTTNYNGVTNWSELTKLYYLNIYHTGGGSWTFTNKDYLPSLSAASRASIKSLNIGQSEVATLDTVYINITHANYPNLENLVMSSNAGELLSGSPNWFVNMPKVKSYLRYTTINGTQVSAAIADQIWNNVRTALDGVVPTGVKELRIDRTSNVTAASQAARDYLTAQGWTVILN
jgi:hypothetical protein